MSLLETIKAKCLSARKAKDADYAKLLITLIGDIEIIGKNDGNRLSTDEECIRTIKKFIKNNEEVMSVTDFDSDAHMNAKDENRLLEQYLPKQFNEEELTNIITGIIAEHEFATMRDMGNVMKHLKAGYDGQYDGKLASTITRAAL